MAEFRVIDLRTGMIEPETVVDANSPEDAAERALGIMAYRSGAPRNLICRVYWAKRGAMNMVRLYSEPRDPKS